MTTATADAWTGADVVIDESACPICLRESCEGCTPTEPLARAPGLDPAALADAVAVAHEGLEIARAGIPYLIKDLIPDYGMAGFLVAYAKVGKTTFGHAIGGAIANGAPILDRATERRRVLVIAAEDPPEYTAYVARHLHVAPGAMTFYRAPLVLDTDGLADIRATIASGGYGFCLISSWQAVVRGLIRDENDNAGAVAVAENVKAAARASGIPWLIDAHSGKGEDASDDADPTRALRGASAAAGAVDYLLSLRYAGSPFGTERRLSGKGRFVSFPPVTIAFEPATSSYTCLGGTKDATRESTWQIIRETGAVDDTARSLTEIARTCGLLDADGRLSGAQRKQLADALSTRPDIGRADGIRRGKKTTLYRRLDGAS
jgi:hypothetical protein